MPEARIIHADCLNAFRDLPDESVHAVVTDPPYGLANTDSPHVVETLSRWFAGERDYLPPGAGFMGKAWDAFVPPPAVWDECMRVLKPGGHLLAFAGTRTLDLMGLSIRLAGFDIRDGITWLYGSGFPKSLDVSKAVDKLDATDERRARALEFTTWMRSTGITTRQVDEATGTNMGGHYLTVESQPAVATADLFDKLRPLLPEVPERIEELVAQRTVESANYAARGVVTELTGHHSGSLSGATVRVLDHGTPATPEAQQWHGWGTALKPASEPIVVARKPLSGTVAQTVLAHGTGALNIDACRVPTTDHWEASGVKSATGTEAGRWPANVVLDEYAAAALDADSGVSKDGIATNRNRSGMRPHTVYGEARVPTEDMGYGGEGGASRFFPVFKYQAKAPTRERPKVEGVSHPTVKPLELMRWLVRLVTPPGGTVLEPFAGSGTTVEAALLEGFDVIGIEREVSYLPLIQQRIDRATVALTHDEPAAGMEGLW